MDSDDLYRKLLVTASHAQQQRHAALHHGSGQHLAGNVFLPAIQQRNATHSALSMKHLHVIEQCILAENRREAELAKSPSEKERRYLTKRFIAQRDHERDLLQALMLGRPTDHELEIVDVNTMTQKEEASSCPLGRHKTKGIGDGTGGVHIIPAHPGKLITMHGEKTFATTTLSSKKALHSPSVKSPTRRRQEHANETVLPEYQTSPLKSSTIDKVKLSPTKVRPIQPVAPKSQKTAADSSLPQTLAHSPFRKSVHQKMRSQRHDMKSSMPSPSPTKRKKKTTPSTTEVDESPLAVTIDSDTKSDHKEVAAISFDDATSFFEARQHAIAIVGETTDAVDDGTQTTDRSYGLDSSPIKERLGLRDQQFKLMLTNDAATSPSKKTLRLNRPQSSPETRTRRPLAAMHPLPVLAPSPPSTDNCRVRVFLPPSDPNTASQDDAVVMFTNDDEETQVQDELATPSDEPAPMKETWCADVKIRNQSFVDEPEETEEDDTSESDALDHLAREDTGLHLDVPEPLPIEYAAVAAAQIPTASVLAVVEDDVLSTVTEDDDAHILEILYDIVQQLEEEDALALDDVVVEKTITIAPTAVKRPNSAFVNHGRFATRIQSAFRGLRTRRAFRLALYQQALECGVLGAMPNTQQGQSGWYQDPKSFMAYYFVVRPDGEWTQKVVLRCSALVLTPYAMREHILARVRGPIDAEEENAEEENAEEENAEEENAEEENAEEENAEDEELM